MADPLITYEDTDNGDVLVSYSGIPENSPASFVDEFGHRTSAGTLTSAGEIAYPTGELMPGRYYMSVGAADDELCRTVDFYVSGQPENL